MTQQKKVQPCKCGGELNFWGIPLIFGGIIAKCQKCGATYVVKGSVLELLG